MLCLAVAPGSALALTPESPQVKTAIEKGLKFLGSKEAEDERVGAQALRAMAFAKNEAPPNHPAIQRAVSSIRAALKNKDGDFNGSEQIYHLGLSLIFLASTDGKNYRSEIDEIMARLLAAQKPHGGWGYPAQETGDTSMTQYGVLGLWESYKAGANPPLQSWERVANWLMRTQDPSGAFGYQGTDPGSFNLVKQSEVRPSMAAAGLGSLYVCLDHFDFGAASESKPEKKEAKLPAALKPIKGKEGPRGKQRPTSVDLGRLRNATALGNRWFDKNFKPAPDEWKYYYVYAYERYQSFREAVEGNSPAEPKWYTDIANSLIKSQQADGTWQDQAGTVPDTAFCILFLSRSTKKSIEKALGAGTLVGGRGLPSDTSNVTMRLGNVMRKPLTGPADQLLSMMENSDDPNFMAAVEGFAEKTLEPDDAQLPEHVVRLRKLAGGQSPAARMVALRALARTRDLDHVPLLIYALRDSDWGVVKEARDGLRFISRKFDAFGPEIPSEDSKPEEIEAGRRKAIQAWQAWYRSIRPEYVFEEE
jgi:hypothetical protein